MALPAPEVPEIAMDQSACCPRGAMAATQPAEVDLSQEVASLGSLVERRRARRRKASSASPTSILSPSASAAGSDGSAEEGIEKEVDAMAKATPAEAALMLENAAREAIAAKEAARSAKRAEIEAKVAAAKLLQAVQAAEAATAVSTKAVRAVKAADLFDEGQVHSDASNCAFDKKAAHSNFIMKDTRMQADYGDKKFIKP
eukprot:scaffold869_cov105-Isochrysis_galbana.AAC.42